MAKTPKPTPPQQASDGLLPPPPAGASPRPRQPDNVPDDAGGDKLPPVPRHRQTNLDDVIRVFHKYRSMLLGLEGVVGVGYGVKRVGGKTIYKTGEDFPGCIIVYVNQKLSGPTRYVHHIPLKWWADEKVGMIPSELDGVATDIRVWPKKFELTMASNSDGSASAPPLVGGVPIIITRTDGHSAGQGTLGMIVKTIPDTNSDPSAVSQPVILSCSHVLFGVVPQVVPSPNGATIKNFTNSQPVGVAVINGFSSFGIDAAIAAIDDPTTAQNQRVTLISAPIVKVLNRKEAPPDVFMVGSGGGGTPRVVNGQLQARLVHGPISFDQLGGSLTGLIEIIGVGGQDFAIEGDSGAMVLARTADGSFGAIGLVVGKAQDPESGQMLTYAQPLTAAENEPSGIFEILNLTL